jgi:hypothetical protein
MSRMLDGIAHVSFPGGGMFLPARSPYDRQLLVEHVADRARSEKHVQVLVDDRRWIVNLNHESAPVICSRCQGALLLSCHSLGVGDAYCVKCALTPQAARNGVGSDPIGADPHIDPRPMMVRSAARMSGQRS